MTPPARLATALSHQAQGIYCLEAAAELLIAHRTWLHRIDFTTGFITLSRGLADGRQMAAVDWTATAQSGATRLGETATPQLP